MTITIRQIQKKDLKKLAEIYTVVYQKFDEKNKCFKERWTIESSKKLLKHFFDRQQDLGFVAECNKKIVGAFIVEIMPWWDGNHLKNGEIFIHPDYQKQGIGTKLLEKVYKKAIKKYNVISFDTFTFRKEEFPLNWYKSHGFKVSDEFVMISGNVRIMLNKLKNCKKQ